MIKEKNDLFDFNFLLDALQVGLFQYIIMAGTVLGIMTLIKELMRDG